MTRCSSAIQQILLDIAAGTADAHDNGEQAAFGPSRPRSKSSRGRIAGMAASIAHSVPELPLKLAADATSEAQILLVDAASSGPRRDQSEAAMPGQSEAPRQAGVSFCPDLSAGTRNAVLDANGKMRSADRRNGDSKADGDALAFSRLTSTDSKEFTEETLLQMRKEGRSPPLLTREQLHKMKQGKLTDTELAVIESCRYDKNEAYQMYLASHQLKVPRPA